MKKFFKVSLIIFLSFVAVIFTTFAIIFLTPSKIELDAKKLINTSDFVNFYDEHNNLISVSSGTVFKEDLTPLSPLIKNAFVAVEDKNFYLHKGLDYKRILKAIYVNLKSFSFKQGASTISQQLIKNTHLTNEKTLKRKIQEIKLVKKLEQNYTKDEIITMYLDTIYFGENTFGIYNASKHYFDLSPNQLSVAQIATLAGLISAPSKLNPNANLDACLKKRNNVINKMYEQNYISFEEKNNALNEPLEVANAETDHLSPYLNACINEIENIKGLSPYSLKNCKVYTYFDKKLQSELATYEATADYQAIVLNNDSCGVLAYYSTTGEIEREIASCVKPILIYAPCIEENYLTEYTKIKDEPTDFFGYKPKNYGDKYYGEVTIKTAISKSLNVPAVKVLDGFGLDKIKPYANKLNIPITNNGLSVALGNLGNGVKLKELASAYTTFANFGEYKNAHFIREIVDNKGITIYKNNEDFKKVYSPATCSVITDCLVDCCKNGTGKKASYLPFEVAVKTGTNGTEKGNLDCYSIGYTTKNTIGVWLGNKDNTLLDNSETGSNTPTYLLSRFFEFLYKDKYPPNFTYQDLTDVVIDKLSYELDGEILIADNNAPKEYTLNLKLKKDSLPSLQSTRFTNYDLDIKVNLNDNKVEFEFVVPNYINLEIYKIFNGLKSQIECDNLSAQDLLNDNGLYDYYAVITILGKEKIICEPQKITTINYEKENATGNPDGIPNEWWIN